MSVGELFSSLTTLMTVLIPALFAALGLVLVAKVNRQPTPIDREDSVAKRMEALVDRLQGELERREEMAKGQEEELRRIRAEMDVLHRLISACYRTLLEHGLELPQRDIYTPHK